MAKIEQTKQDLENEFKEQLELLELHCKTYDEGSTLVAKHIATLVRVLVHDTRNSHSLLGQLNRKNEMYDSSPIEADLDGVTHIGARSFLVGTGIGQNSQYIPFLDDTPQRGIGWTTFDEWWNRPVLNVDSENIFSRKYIILKLANQAGGAHVDPKLDEKYYKLTRENLLGVKSSFNGEESKDILGIELAITRQVGHEVLKTFKDQYHKKMVIHGQMAIIGGIGGMFTSDPNIILKMMKGDDEFEK